MSAGHWLAPLIALAIMLAASAGDAAAADRKRTTEALLFSDTDFDRLVAAWQAAGDPTATPTLVGPANSGGSMFSDVVIHLSAILYDGPDDWRVWLNGRPWTPASPADQIEIVQVAPDAVTLHWHRGFGRASVPIELRPNQSFVAASGAIVEGPGPVVSTRGRQ